MGARLDAIERRAGDADLAWALGLTCEQCRNVVAASAVAIRRLQTAEKVEAAICETFAYAQTVALVVHRMDMTSGVIINPLVKGPGTGRDLPEVTDVPRDPTMPEPAPGRLPRLPSDLQATAPERGRWPAFRLSAWRRATRGNAAWSHARRIDIEQNQRLGQLLDRLRG